MKPNKICEKENHIEIEIISKGKKYICLIDKEDYSKVKDYRWSLTWNGYATTKKQKSNLWMHRIVMQYEGKNDIDHINHNKLDNRKSNLRIATRSQNNMNRLKTKGYYYDKENEKWRAYIEKDGRRIYLGRFETEEEALKSRKEAERKIFKDFSFSSEVGVL